MALWENISKKTAQTTAKVAQQARVLSESNRLNGLIAEQEEKINETYFQLGKLYAAIHFEDYESDFAGMIQTIAEAQTKIAEYRAEIQKVRGVVRCENCGAEVQKGVAFCSTCGAQIPREDGLDPSQFVRCDGCGASVERGARFCTTCGKPMRQIPAAAVSAPTEPVLTDEVPREFPRTEPVLAQPGQMYSQSEPDFPRTEPVYPQAEPEYPQAEPECPREEPEYPREEPVYPFAAPEYPSQEPAAVQAEPVYPFAEPEQPAPEPEEPVYPFAPPEEPVYPFAPPEEEPVFPKTEPVFTREEPVYPFGQNMYAAPGFSQGSQDLQQQEPSGRFCPNCGAENLDDSLFCTECGTRLA